MRALRIFIRLILAIVDLDNFYWALQEFCSFIDGISLNDIVSFKDFLTMTNKCVHTYIISTNGSFYQLRDEEQLFCLCVKSEF